MSCTGCSIIRGKNISLSRDVCQTLSEICIDGKEIFPATGFDISFAKNKDCKQETHVILDVKLTCPSNPANSFYDVIGLSYQYRQGLYKSLALRKVAPFLFKSGSKEPAPYHEIWYFDEVPYVVPFSSSKFFEEINLIFTEVS